MNYKFVFSTIGKILHVEALLMLLPLGVSFYYEENSVLPFSFLLTIILLFGTGALLRLKRGGSRRVFAREGFVTVALSWILISFFGCLPFVFSGAIPQFADAYFETASGFSTTGATILSEIESLPKSILFWRSFTHWIGGMGVLVFVLAVIPKSETHSMHIMRAEVPGTNVGKLVSKTSVTARILYGMYLGLTVLEIVLLLVGNMPLFDSVVTAFSTAGTGGFAIKNASIAAYGSAYAEVVVTVFMLVFGVNFNLYYLILLRQFKRAFKSEELHAYLLIVAAAIAAITVGIYPMYQNVGTALRLSAFQVAALISTTGFSTADYMQWPVFTQAILMLLLFLGGCAGSTGGGLKVERFVILVKSGVKELRHALNPKAVVNVKMDKKTVSKETVTGVKAYFAIYMLVLAVGTLVICFDKYDITTSFSAVATCLNNVGPGLNAVGPAFNFSGFSVFSKVFLSFIMLMGRLELLPMLMLFNPRVWRRDV